MLSRPTSCRNRLVWKSRKRTQPIPCLRVGAYGSAARNARHSVLQSPERLSLRRIGELAEVCVDRRFSPESVRPCGYGDCDRKSRPRDFRGHFRGPFGRNRRREVVDSTAPTRRLEMGKRRRFDSLVSVAPTVSSREHARVGTSDLPRSKESRDRFESEIIKKY